MKKVRIMLVFSLLILNISLIFPGKSQLSEENVTVYQVTHTGSFILITLDYNFNSSPERDGDSLVVFIAFILPGDQIGLKATMLFFHTNEGVPYLYWTLNNPADLSSEWLIGTEYENFMLDSNDLSLLPLEVQVTNNQLQIVVSAKRIFLNTIDPTSDEIQKVLQVFIQELTSSLEFQSTTTAIDSTSETTTQSSISSSTSVSKQTETVSTSAGSTSPQMTSGYELYLIIGIMSACTAILKLKRQKFEL